MKILKILCSAVALVSFTNAALAEPQAVPAPAGVPELVTAQSEAPARPVELSDAQMDDLTAGQGAVYIIILSAVQATLQLPPGEHPPALLLPAVQSAREGNRR